MKENIKKGFIQIPILLGIIVATLIIGGGGYFIAKNYVRQNNNSDSDEKITELEEKIFQLQKNFGKSDDNYNDQLDNQVVEKTIIREIIKEIPQENNSPETTPTLSTSETNKADSSPSPEISQCDNIKNEFNDFEKKYNEAYYNFLRANSIFSKDSSSSDLSGLSYFKYLYSKYTSNKDIFFQYIAKIKEIISQMTTLSLDTKKLTDALKGNFQNGSNEYSYAYNINLEVYKNISENQSYSTIDASISSLETSETNYDNGYNHFKAGIANFNLLKNIYDKALKERGCKGFCDGGYMLYQGNCVEASKKVTDLSPSSGTFDTIFVIKGSDFGDTQKSDDGVIVGNQPAKIIQWSNTEIKFKTEHIVLQGLYSVRFQDDQVFIGTIKLIK